MPFIGGAVIEALGSRVAGLAWVLTLGMQGLAGGSSGSSLS